MLFFLTLQESAARQRILQAAKLCVCIAAEGLDGSFPFSSPFFLRLRSKNLLSQEEKKRDLHQQHQRNADGKLLFSCLVMDRCIASRAPGEPPAAAKVRSVETRILHFPYTAFRLSIP